MNLKIRGPLSYKSTDFYLDHLLHLFFSPSLQLGKKSSLLAYDLSFLPFFLPFFEEQVISIAEHEAAALSSCGMSSSMEVGYLYAVKCILLT